MKNFLIVFSLLFFFSCQSDNKQQETQLGELELEVSGSEAAIPIFKEGLMLLHSFEFKDAAEKFRAAQAEDPGFAMAYWGRSDDRKSSIVARTRI